MSLGKRLGTDSIETRMFNVDGHPDGYGELELSRAWYEERAQNLGTEFLVEVDRAIETVRESSAM